MVLNQINIEIFYQNVRGLRTKCSEFTNNIYVPNYKIYCVTETWLNDTVNSYNLFPATYSVFRADRDYQNYHGTRGGGVLIAISNLI
jgi:hypothetical protein